MADFSETFARDIDGSVVAERDSPPALASLCMVHRGVCGQNGASDLLSFCVLRSAMLFTHFAQELTRRLNEEAGDGRELLLHSLRLLL